MSDQRVANREKDFRFLQLQNLFELEMHYQVSPNIEITNVNHFLYDGVYNWQDSAGLFAPRVSETMRHYHNFDRIVRELYVSYRTHSLDVVLGKQQKSFKRQRWNLFFDWLAHIASGRIKGREKAVEA